MGIALNAPFCLAEIPVLQVMGALYMGNKVLFKTDSKVGSVRVHVRTLGEL